MGENYLTVTGEFENVTVIERSKFICKIKGVENEDDAKNFVAAVKKEHSLATHNCYAYIADEKGLIQKFSDDGEPQGTAGIPMLETLKSKGLSKVVAVVTRYFGGIKLGTGGLARAYSGAVGDCLDNCKICKMEKVAYVTVYTDYGGYSKVSGVCNQLGVKILNTEFNDAVVFRTAVKESVKEKFFEKLTDVFCGNIKYEITGGGFEPFGVNE